MVHSRIRNGRNGPKNILEKKEATLRCILLSKTSQKTQENCQTWAEQAKKCQTSWIRSGGTSQNSNQLPTLTWRRGVLMKRRESSCSSGNGVSNWTRSTAVNPRSKPQIAGCCRQLMPQFLGCSAVFSLVPTGNLSVNSPFVSTAFQKS